MTRKKKGRTDIQGGIQTDGVTTHSVPSPERTTVECKGSNVSIRQLHSDEIATSKAPGERSNLDERALGGGHINCRVRMSRRRKRYSSNGEGVYTDGQLSVSIPNPDFTRLYASIVEIALSVAAKTKLCDRRTGARRHSSEIWAEGAGRCGDGQSCRKEEALDKPEQMESRSRKSCQRNRQASQSKIVDGRAREQARNTERMKAAATIGETRLSGQAS